MPVLEAHDRTYSEVEHVGVAILTTAPGYWHAGLLYRLPEEAPRLLHLEGHHVLTDELAAQPYRWAQLGIDADNKAVLATLISRIARLRPKIPYSFDCEGVLFNPTTGDLSPPPAGKGLTCATLIIAVLATYGYQLLDIESWPDRADDANLIGNMATHMLEQGADAIHVGAMRASNTVRVRPPEAVGSANLNDNEWPVDFGTADHMAQQVIMDLA